MPTYDEVKTKISTLRKRILADMTYKRFERKKKVIDATLSAIKSILSEINNSVNATDQLAVDVRAIELFNSVIAKSPGMKKVSVNYADDTTIIDNREVIPFDVFTYDPTLYYNNVKSFADALSRRLVVYRIPQSETPPEGDFEDVSYVYYQPSRFIPQESFEVNFYDVFGEYGSIYYFAEYDMYNMNWTDFKVESVRGSYDHFDRSIDNSVVMSLIGTGGVLKVIDPNTNNYRCLAYKYVVMTWNFTTYDVDTLIGNKPHKTPSNSFTCYVYLTDIHLKSTPICILTHNFS